MTRRALIYSAACILLAMAVLCTAARSEQDAPATINDDLIGDLKDKIVLLEVNRSSAVESDSDTVLLKNVRLTKLGNRHFLVGIGYTAPDEIEYWYNDMLIGVPCDSILRFNAMTLEQCTKFMKKWKEHVQD